MILKKSQDVLLNLITKVPNRLEALCLRGDLLGDEAAIKIFNGLKNELNYLRILNLFKNELTDNCVKVLGETMLVNRRLEEVNLGNNRASLPDAATSGYNFDRRKKGTDFSQSFPCLHF